MTICLGRHVGRRPRADPLSLAFGGRAPRRNSLVLRGRLWPPNRTRRASGFPRPCLCVAGIAIAPERLQPAPQQAYRCDVCAVAHDGCGVAHCDGCAVLSVVASHVSQWLQRSRWRAQWGSERPERLPAPGPPTAQARPKAQSPASPPSQAGKASFGAKRFPYRPPCFEAFPAPYANQNQFA